MKPVKQAAIGFLAASALLAGAHQATATPTPLWPVAEPDVYGERTPTYDFIKDRRWCGKTMCYWTFVVEATQATSLEGKRPKLEARPSVYALVGSDAFTKTARFTSTTDPIRVVATGGIYGLRRAGWKLSVRNMPLPGGLLIKARGWYPKNAYN